MYRSKKLDESGRGTILFRKPAFFNYKVLRDLILESINYLRSIHGVIYIIGWVILITKLCFINSIYVTVIGQANRHYIQGRGYISGAAYDKCSPFHELRLENGGIVFARNSNQGDSSMSFPQNLKSHHPYEIKSLSSRSVS